MSALIPLTRGQVAIVDDEDADLASFKWHAKPNRQTFYARRRVWVGNGKQIDVSLHRTVAERMGISAHDVDHKDRNGLNCTRENLRGATRSQNTANRPRQADNKSGYKGVHWSSRWKRWVAGIRANGKKRHLGYFSDPVTAAHAYDRAAVEVFGEFAYLNFPAKEAT